MKDLFKSLYEYNAFANSKIIETITANSDKVDDKAKALMSHTLRAHTVLNSRMTQNPITVTLWQDVDVNDMQAENERLYQESLQLIENRDMNEVIAYKTMQGVPFTSVLNDILFHVINHSTYHRGQINSSFRASDIEPLVLDYIAYKRIQG